MVVAVHHTDRTFVKTYALWLLDWALDPLLVGIYAVHIVKNRIKFIVHFVAEKQQMKVRRDTKAWNHTITVQCTNVTSSSCTTPTVSDTHLTHIPHTGFTSDDLPLDTL